MRPPLRYRTYTVYALIDPVDQRVRYISHTKQPVRIRVHDQLYLAEEGPTPLHRWLKTLLKRGLRPDVALIETHIPTPRKARAVATEWYTRLVAQGNPMLNHRYEFSYEED